MTALLLIVPTITAPPSVARAGEARTTRQGTLVLFTPEEANQLRMTEADWPRPSRTRALSSGPRVVIEHPEVKKTEAGATIQTSVPTKLVVHFEPTGAPVDMSSLQVKARKGLFSKSLTELLKPYLHGTTLNVDTLSVPEGNFLIEIEIADTQGGRTFASYRLLVSAT